MQQGQMTATCSRVRPLVNLKTTQTIDLNGESLIHCGDECLHCTVPVYHVQYLKNIYHSDGLMFIIQIAEYSLINLLINLFIHSGYFYSASSIPLLLRGAPDYSIDTVSELTR